MKRTIYDGPHNSYAADRNLKAVDFSAAMKLGMWFFTPETRLSYDAESSDRSGYPIFRSNIEHYDYACDLGDRLEVNIKDGNRTINIWYDPDIIVH